MDLQLHRPRPASTCGLPWRYGASTPLTVEDVLYPLLPPTGSRAHALSIGSIGHSSHSSTTTAPSIFTPRSNNEPQRRATATATRPQSGPAPHSCFPTLEARSRPVSASDGSGKGRGGQGGNSAGRPHRPQGRASPPLREAGQLLGHRSLSGGEGQSPHACSPPLHPRSSERERRHEKNGRANADDHSGELLDPVGSMWEEAGEGLQARPELPHGVALLTHDETQHTFLSDRLFSEVLVKGSAYHANPLLQRILHASTPADSAERKEGREEGERRRNPLAAAVSVTVKQYGLRAVSREVFRPLLTAAFARCEARQAKQQRRRAEGSRGAAAAAGGEGRGSRAAALQGERTSSRKRHSTTRTRSFVARDAFVAAAADTLTMPTDEEAALAIAARDRKQETHRHPGKIEEADYDYLFRFIDWEGFGSMDPHVFLARLELLTRPLFILQATVFIYLVFFKSTQGLSGGHAEVSSHVRTVKTKTDLFSLQQERLSLVHQQLLVSLLELEKMLASVLESFYFTREEELQRTGRTRERRATATEGTREPDGEAPTHSAAVALPERRRNSVLAKRRRQAQASRRAAEEAAREVQQRSDTRRYVEGTLRPACREVVARCAAVHDGAFRVTVGQLRHALFASPELIAVLDEIVDLYLPV